ncbi:mechanosensitive ion channel domain-containing protein [Hoeflea sp.]|uniref:mechanosensitive ion channel domain-containing protein n=1 Tax=Hoeflea sp. TaxID=1940281 RepID=UPI003B01D47C
MAILRSVLLVLAVTLCAAQANAQAGLTTLSDSSETGPTTVELPEDLTPETVRELVSRLSDQQVRGLLLERLDAVAKENAAPQESEGRAALDFLGESFVLMGLLLAQVVTEVPRVFVGVNQSFNSFAGPRGLNGVLTMFSMMAIAIAIGLVVENIVTRMATNWRKQIEAADAPDGLKATLEVLGKRLILELLGLFAFFAVTRILIEFLVPGADRPLMPILMINLVVVPRLFAAISRFLLAPNRPDLRLVYTDDWTARFLFRNQLYIVILAGLSIVIFEFQMMHNVSLDDATVGFWLEVAVFVWIAYVLYRARDGLTAMLIGAEENDVTPTERLIARAYPWCAVFLVIVTWVLVQMIIAQGRFDLLSDAQHYVTLGLLLSIPVFDTMVRGLVRHLVPPMRGQGIVAEAAYQSTKRSYVRIGRAGLIVATIIVLADIWQIDFTDLAHANLGTRIAANLIENLFLIACGYLVWELVSLWINRKLADEQTAAGIDLEAEEPGGGEGGGEGGSRLSTVLPLIKIAAQVSIITLTVLIVLGNLGIDITPLLAGAGIIGLAIGFGAQTLVRDIVSGLFFLFDDAFRVGEYLDIDGTVGTVERISIRSLQLRHHQGPVHTIPYGEIPKVTNRSRDWVIVKLKFTVPFDTDVNKVKKLFKQIGKDIMEAPYAEDIIQTFKSQGVYDVNDVGIIVRGKFMAKPGKQWMIRKDVYARVQKIFAENGIEFARREVRVKMPEGEEAQDNTGAAAAAHAAIQEQVEQETGSADKPA